jgi:hypothetical protein
MYHTPNRTAGLQNQPVDRAKLAILPGRDTKQQRRHIPPLLITFGVFDFTACPYA